MIRISEAASLAVHGMALLAAAGPGRLSVETMAKQTAASQAHLAKVLQRLAKAELVEAVRGPGGGYSLARPAEDISLLEVYEAIEGPLPEQSCLRQGAACPFARCLFGDLFHRVTNETREYFAGRSLLDVVQGKKGGRGRTGSPPLTRGVVDA